MLQETSHATHLRQLLDKRYKYEKDPTRIVGVTERTRDAERTDGWIDGPTDRRSETNIPPTTSLCVGGIIRLDLMSRQTLV